MKAQLNLTLGPVLEWKFRYHESFKIYPDADFHGSAPAGVETFHSTPPPNVNPMEALE